MQASFRQPRLSQRVESPDSIKQSKRETNKGKSKTQRGKSKEPLTKAKTKSIIEKSHDSVLKNTSLGPEKNSVKD